MKSTRLGLAVLCGMFLQFALRIDAAEAPVKNKASTGPLLPFQEDGKWGFIDRTGEVIYKPQFSGELREPKFANGYAVVKMAGRLMWLSESGDVVLPEDEIAFAGGYSNGLFRVNVGQQIRMGDILANAGLWGFVDKRGRAVIPAKYVEVGDFSDGLARAGSRKEGERRSKWGYIDKAGKWVIEPKFLQAGSFFEGLAFVGLAVPGERFVKQALINNMGRMIVPPKFDQARGFSNGFAAVKLGDKWAYINTMGQPICKFEYEAAEPIRDGLGLVWKWEKSDKGQLVNARCGFMNARGNLVTKLEFPAGYSHSDGMAAVQVDGKFGYVDSKGKLAIAPQYTSANAFSEGLAAVQIDGKTGYINKSGKVVIEPQFEFGQPFSNHVARVLLDRKQRKYGYIDTKGKLLRTYQLQPPRGGFFEG
jgi:hypothetical protein